MNKLLAQYTPDILPTIQEYELVTLIKDMIAGVIIVAAALCLAFIIVGGISFILSGGQEDKIKQAVNTIRYAIIGLIVVILSVALVNLVTFIFKIPFKFVDYREIFQKIRNTTSYFEPSSYNE